ncbi:MAG: hypothetical protein ABIS35_07605 [Terracoccus sp.]
MSRTATGLLAAVLLVGGCTSSGDPAPTGSAGARVPGAATTAALDGTDAAALLSRATAQAKAARSGAFAGTIRDQGEQATVAFLGTSDGSSVDVRKAAAKAGTVRLISVDGTVYVKADDTFWSSQNVPFIVSLAGGKFIKVPAGVVPVLGELTLASFVDRSIATFPATDLSDTVGEETVNTIPSWVLTTTSGEPKDGALYVSKETSEVIRWIGTSAHPGQLDFSRWNVDLGIAPPPGDQVFSIG